MYTYKRESLFDFKTFMHLNDFSIEEVQQLKLLKVQYAELKEDILIRIKELSKSLYLENNQEELKKVMKIRDALKKDKIQNALLDKVDSATQLAKIKLEIENLYEVLNQKINKENKYHFFLQNENFKKLILETNAIAFEQIINEEKYRKVSYKKNRYSYIQRNILKTNALSYTGITSFPGEQGVVEKSLREVKQVNPYFVSAVLEAMTRNPKIVGLLKYQISPFVKRADKSCLLQKIQNISIDFKSFYIRENLLFSNEYNSFLKNKSNSEGQELRYLDLSEIRHDLKFVIENHLININKDFYRDLNNLQDLLKIDENLRDISNKLVGDGNEVITKGNLQTYLQSFGVEQEIINVICNEPVYISYIGYSDSKKNFFDVTKSKDFQKNKIADVVVENQKYKTYAEKLYELHLQHGNKTLLDYLFDLEGKILYREDYWKTNSDRPSYQIKCKQKKSYSIFFNKLDNDMIFYNNIYPGNGFLLGREFLKMDSVAKKHIDEYLKTVYPANREMCELVIDNDISSNVNTGHSPYQKIYWPQDIKDIEIEFLKGELIFKYMGKLINLIYFGSIPIHLYSGAKGILLNLLSPWRMEGKMKEKLMLVNDRQSFKVNYNQIEKCLVKDPLTTMLNLIEHFEVNQMPIQFFLYAINNPFQKPIYISLLNLEAVHIFIEYVKQQDMYLMEQNPNGMNYNCSSKLIEYINLIVEEEL